MKFDTAAKDEVLCAYAAAGNRIAEEQLVIRYHRLVRACARPLFLMGGDSEDLTQEGMLGLIKAIRDYDPNRGASFYTFAETCIKSRMYSAIRAAAGNRHIPLNQSVPIENPLFEAQNQLSYTETDPEVLYISREAVTERMDVLRSKLSGFETEVLRLYLNGLSYLEIADQTHRSLKSVDNAVQRIRRKLDH